MGNVIEIEMKVKIQRLLDLTAQIENFNAKLTFGQQPSPAEYDRLSDNRREFAELLGDLNLRPPIV